MGRGLRVRREVGERRRTVTGTGARSREVPPKQGARSILNVLPPFGCAIGQGKTPPACPDARHLQRSPAPGHNRSLFRKQADGD